MQRKNDRPSIQERYNNIHNLNTFIEVLNAAYEEDHNEKVRFVISKLRDLKAEGMDIEYAFRDEELQEFWQNPGAYPESVRSWIIFYRDKENE